MGVDKNVECQQTDKRYGMLRVGKNVATYSAEPRGRRNIRGRPGGLIQNITTTLVAWGWSAEHDTSMWWAPQGTIWELPKDVHDLLQCDVKELWQKIQTRLQK